MEDGWLNPFFTTNHLCLNIYFLGDQIDVQVEQVHKLASVFMNELLTFTV